MTDQPEITIEINDYDRAVGKEAHRRACASEFGAHVGEVASALVRNGWKPVDPDLIEARKMAAETYPEIAKDYLAGKWDNNSSTVQSRLAGIKRGRELERGQ